MDSCRLCSSLTSHNDVDFWNKPIFESQNFVVLPSLGALVKGWLLLIPKAHYLCFGALPEDAVSELCAMKMRVRESLQRYGDVYVFEHGPSRPNHAVGCSVDHAHLHFAPLGFDIVHAMNPFLPEGTSWSRAGLPECQAAFGRHCDYLYVEQPTGVGWIANHNGFGSQLFRHAIAAHLGTPELFNWRENPQLPDV
jgi:diadenosine tetraphosphate (Ap4A) HIT family hydrolase